MSRQRLRAILTRMQRIQGRDVTAMSLDQLVSHTIEIDKLKDQWRSLTIERPEGQPNMTPAEARLCRHYKDRHRP